MALCSDDHGNDAGGATVGEFGERFEGKLESAGDEDWFRFDLAEAGTLTLESEGQSRSHRRAPTTTGTSFWATTTGAPRLLLVTNVGSGSY
ncbi:MAG: hypothetical protein F4139_00550 [Gemmatimonadetes bacterium]|nr:hypothetical protein [Gemmatimonadota bacterium]MXW16327.1 hypothetical protein [Gemmatimonadota bacterium]MYA63569.1 hypothetical protein [Gemmatimonadota bacterium]MYB96956.1 hypothetical protein [Gemmatimonadota bacterium]MYH51418.1 hypothetical protein [Gemmatimonadota bacterium]